jgi:PAS domain S-box-containing protein
MEILNNQKDRYKGLTATYIRQVSAYLPYMVMAAIILIILLYQPFSRFMANEVLTAIWTVLISSLLLLPLTFYILRNRLQHYDELSDKYLLRLLTLNALVFAAMWSSMLLINYANAVREYQLLILLLILGICASAFPLFVFFKHTYVMFISILMLPIINLELWINGDWINGIAMIMLFLILASSAYKLGDFIRSLLYERREDLQLLDQLSNANVSLRGTNEQLEEENSFRLQATQVYREKSDFLERIMDATNDAIIVLDSNGYIMKLNQKVAELTGYYQEEMLGRHYVDNILPDADPIISGLIHNAISNNTLSACEQSWIFDKSGHLIDIKISINRMETQGELSAVVCTLVDISREKSSERLKDEFISTVSHELRTPLTSIHGSLRLMEKGIKGELPSEFNELMGIAVRNSERLGFLINDLLDVQKLNYGKLEFNYEVHDACDLVKEAVFASKGYAYNYNVELSFKRCTSVSILVDKSRLIQVLFNLISNAIKFTPKGKHVDVDMWSEGDTLRISIEDQGGGIPEAFQSRIFERFSQSRDMQLNHYQGTGLGLYIAKQIIESMGGSIAYKTRIGHGTAFFVDIDIADASIGQLRSQ